MFKNRNTTWAGGVNHRLSTGRVALRHAPFVHEALCRIAKEQHPLKLLEQQCTHDTRVRSRACFIQRDHNRNSFTVNLELCRHPCKLRRCTDDDLAERQILASACWRNCASSLFTARTHTSLAFDITSASKPRTNFTSSLSSRPKSRRKKKKPPWAGLVSGGPRGPTARPAKTSS